MAYKLRPTPAMPIHATTIATNREKKTGIDDEKRSDSEIWTRTKNNRVECIHWVHRARAIYFFSLLFCAPLHFYLEINNLISYRRNESESAESETSRQTGWKRQKQQYSAHQQLCCFHCFFRSLLIFPLNATCCGGGVFRIFHFVAARQFRIYWRPIKPCVRCVYRISMIIIFAFFIIILFLRRNSVGEQAHNTHTYWSFRAECVRGWRASPDVRSAERVCAPNTKRKLILNICISN